MDKFDPVLFQQICLGLAGASFAMALTLLFYNIFRASRENRDLFGSSRPKKTGKTEAPKSLKNWRP